MRNVEEVREALARLDIKKVAEGTGRSYMQVWRLASGNFQKPPFDLVADVNDYIDRHFCRKTEK